MVLKVNFKNPRRACYISPSPTPSGLYTLPLFPGVLSVLDLVDTLVSASKLISILSHLESQESIGHNSP